MKLEIKIPSPGESITEVVMANWLKASGDFVNKDEVLCEIETDKATLPLYAETSGVLTILIPSGANANVGDIACTIDTTASATAKAPAASAPSAAKPANAAPSAATPNYAAGTPSPSAAKILSEKGVSPASVSGTGKDGRITKEDAVNASAPQAAAPAAAKKADAPKAPPAAPVFTGARKQRREKMTTLRKKIASRLVAVKNETAMLTTFNEVDMSFVMDLRNKYKDKFADKHGVKLGFMSFFTKAVCEAMRDFPAVNAMIDGQEIVFNDYIDVGIAVSAPKGLVVPVVRNAEMLTLAQIEAEIQRLALRARDNKLSIDEMTGGTFSITNGGVFGSMLSTPILNPPQSAILGMHNTVQRPIAVNNQVIIRPIMYVALSYDHRIIDGKESVSFLYKVKEYLEDPARMLLGV